MDFQTPRNPRRAPSEDQRLARVSERLARADTPRRQVTQKLEQALRLSQLTALPATEAFRLITRYGLGFAATVEDWLQEGCTLTQAFLRATQGLGEDGAAMSGREARAGRTPQAAASLQPAPCQGCQHYYGHIDGQRLLICAMYPYGPDTDPCEDWHAVDRDPPRHDPVEPWPRVG